MGVGLSNRRATVVLWCHCSTPALGSQQVCSYRGLRGATCITTVSLGLDQAEALKNSCGQWVWLMPRKLPGSHQGKLGEI